jgi:hypothetical protein
VIFYCFSEIITTKHSYLRVDRAPCYSLSFLPLLLPILGSADPLYAAIVINKLSSFYMKSLYCTITRHVKDPLTLSVYPAHNNPTVTVPYPPHWEKLARKELGGEIGPRELEWITPEGIKLKPLYTGMRVFSGVCMHIVTCRYCSCSAIRCMLLVLF